MNIAMPQRQTVDKAKAAIIDCDIHPFLRSPAAIEPYLSQRWRDHLRAYGSRMRDPLGGRVYPNATPMLSRRDSWPPGGGPPGSDLQFMREQHLDPVGIAFGILQPLVPGGRDDRNTDFGVALCRAINEWQVAEWTSKEPRLKASICVPYEDPPAAVEEIERWAEHADFAQILMVPRTREPLGTKKYWPIYEAAARHGFPMGMHVGGTNGVAPTGSGWPSFYGENHLDHALALQAATANLILEGVFERFPALKFVVVEGGFAWVPSLGWRMDQYWSRLRDEVPHLKRPPSEYLKQNVWFTTQPIDEPENPGDIIDLVDTIGWDRILFASDYPHWDTDHPKYAFRVPLPKEREQQIMSGNARTVYRLR